MDLARASRLVCFLIAGIHLGHAQNKTAEQYVLSRVKHGVEADLVGAGIKDRTLSTRFLKLLLTGAYKNGEMEREGVHIRGAVFPHRVIIKNAAVPYSVWLKDCQFLEGADFEYTRFDHDLSLEGSTFLATLDAKRKRAASRPNPLPLEVNFLAIGMQVKGPLNLNRAVFHAPINLTYADIGGDLYVDSVQYLSTEIADLQCLRVRGLTFFRHDSFAATLRLSDSDLFQVYMEDSQTIPRLELDRTKVERGFSFSDTTVGALAAAFSPWTAMPFLTMSYSRRVWTSPTADFKPSQSADWRDGWERGAFRSREFLLREWKLQAPAAGCRRFACSI